MPRDRNLIDAKAVLSCLEAFVCGGKVLAVEDATGAPIVSGSTDAAEVVDALASATSTTTLILRRPGSSTVTRYGFKSVPLGLVIVSSEDRTYH